MGKGLRIKTALYEYNENRKKKKRLGDIAKKVYPSIKDPGYKVTGVIKGTIKVNRDEVELFCEQLKCDPNKLFGYEEK